MNEINHPNLEWDYDTLWEHVVSQFHGGRGSIHGPRHWKRVKRFGLKIANESGADETVVRLFALFHDSRRVNDGHDPGHGARGAEFATELRGEMFEVDEEQFEKLVFACRMHTDQHHHDDVTIGTCWDDDRLDLERVAIRPSADYLNTDAAKRAADIGPDRFLEE